jgi:NADPH-dependent curcumin reductase CurA
LFVVGLAAYASVQTVAPQAGETVVVSAAAGGVGSVAVQLARHTEARVIGLAGEQNHDWLRRHDIVPVTYGDGLAERSRAAAGGKIDSFIDTFGGGYVDLAIGLGVAPQRINTIADFEAVQHKGADLDNASSLFFEGAPPREMFGDGVAAFVEKSTRDDRRKLVMSFWQD